MKVTLTPFSPRSPHAHPLPQTLHSPHTQPLLLGELLADELLLAGELIGNDLLPADPFYNEPFSTDLLAVDLLVVVLLAGESFAADLLANEFITTDLLAAKILIADLLSDELSTVPISNRRKICKKSLYDQIFRPSKLSGNADFHCFKAGIEPKWEDPECANGGKWSVASSRKATLDTMWLETCVASHPNTRIHFLNGNELLLK
uniref:eIF-(iso)4F 25 kDa subunit n=1 Tax=Ananas comosus var. bracteatus TaxID=296719 RepID=A0A6V7P581_ANACO|nr:unnamed protein product [Ananas comosus var. bracteatus]